MDPRTAALFASFTGYVAAVYNASFMAALAAAYRGSPLDVDARLAAISVAV